MPTVTFSRSDQEWVVRGEPRRAGNNGELLLVHEDLHIVTATDLKNALLSEHAYWGGSDHAAGANVTEMSEDYFDADGPLGMIRFDVVDKELQLTITSFTDWPDNDDESQVVNQITAVVKPLLRHVRGRLERVAVSDNWTGPPLLAIDVQVFAPTRGKTVSDLHQLGQDILRLCDAFGSGDVARDTVADLVRGGGAHLLIDQPEGDWLDAKESGVRPQHPRRQDQLAKAVARFANGQDGGLVVIGARTKRVPGGETIRHTRGVVPRQIDSPSRYSKVLDQHLYPLVLGLRIDLVPTADDRALILLDLPPQPEELKPFLVQGAITADGKTESSFISIVVRRGEGSIPLTAPMIHATLAAGRALLRGERQS